jgi:hypothetical protein
VERRWYEAGDDGFRRCLTIRWSAPCCNRTISADPFTALNQDSTLIVVIEMSQSSWLVAGMVPGVERQPLKKLESDEDQLLKLMDRWRHEAIPAGREIERVVVAFEGRGATDFGWRAGCESGASRPMTLDE